MRAITPFPLVCAEPARTAIDPHTHQKGGIQHLQLVPSKRLKGKRTINRFVVRPSAATYVRGLFILQTVGLSSLLKYSIQGLLILKMSSIHARVDNSFQFP
jgi:hypothetical protein